MANANVSRIGQVNGAGDPKAIFLKVASGEVLAAFDRTTKFMDKHVVRNIASGKSASFPASGRASAHYHTPGQEILGEIIKHAERVITIDDLLISDKFIANYDEAMAHYDMRGEYTSQIGEALAQQFDRNVARVIAKCAELEATVDGLPGGSVITNADYRTDGKALATAFFDAAQLFDEKDVPESERFGAVKPAQYYLLAQTTDVINKDWGGEGSYAKGNVQMIAEIPIVKTSNLPTTDDTALAKVPEKYRGDFSNTAALFWHRSAVGTVKLVDLAMESEYDIRRQGTLLLGKYAVGHGELRPESAIAAKVA